MKYRCTTGTYCLATSAAMGTLAILSLGCSHAHRTALQPIVSPTFAAAGKLIDEFRSGSGFVETHTVSLALDRIDQRELPLDRTYRHQGTGRGIVVYVFDGGVL